MKHGDVVKRAWQIMLRYRVLWVFGFIIALASAGGGGSGGSGSPGGSGPSGSGAGGPELPPEIERFFFNFDFQEMLPILIAIGVALICLAIAIGVLFAIARYVSETALIKLVDDYEETEETKTIRDGFRIGWSRDAWRLFLTELLTRIPTFIIVLIPILLVAGIAFLLASQGGFDGGGPVGGSIALIVLAVVVVIGAILIAIVVGTVLELLKQFVWRKVALNGDGVIPAFEEGYSMIRDNLKDVGLMWLIMLGIGIGIGIVLIPVTILVLIIAAIVGGVVVLVIGGGGSLLFPGGASWIIGGVLGFLLFLPVFIIPTTFIGGLVQVYSSSVWTLTYRALNKLADGSESMDVAPAV